MKTLFPQFSYTESKLHLLLFFDEVQAHNFYLIFYKFTPSLVTL